MSFPYNNIVYNSIPIASTNGKKLIDGEINRHISLDGYLQSQQSPYSQYQQYPTNLSQQNSMQQLSTSQYPKQTEIIDRQAILPENNVRMSGQSSQDYSGARVLNSFNQSTTVQQNLKTIPLMPAYPISQVQTQYSSYNSLPIMNQRNSFSPLSGSLVTHNLDPYYHDHNFPRQPIDQNVLLHPTIPSYFQTNEPYGFRKDLDTIVAEYHQKIANPRTFKPPKPKENNRPRINKLTRPENVQKLFNHPITEIGEYSVDELKQIFLNHLCLTEPFNKLNIFTVKLKTEIEYQMFNYFVNNLSTQLDVLFEVKVYSEIVSQMALFDESNILLQSIFCLSSLMLHRMMPDKIDASLPLKYYHHSVKTIKSYSEMFYHDTGISSRCLLATTLLSVYEFYFTSIEGVYTGNASSILASIIQGDHRSSTSPLLGSTFLATCFWSVFTLGYIQSLKNVRVNVFSVELFWKPLDSEYFTVFDKYLSTEDQKSKNSLSKTEMVWWFRKTILICSQISDFKGEVIVPTKEEKETNQNLKRWIQLKDMLVDFENNLPSNLEPIVYNIQSDQTFPVIFFKDELTTLIGINRSLAKLMLFEAMFIKTNTQLVEVRNELNKFPPDYTKRLAKDLIGMIKCYDSNSAILPLNLHVLHHVQGYINDEEQAVDELTTLIGKSTKVCNLSV